MPKVTQDHKDERRDFILEAAARCFARQGFHATSVADVIAETGLSTGSVYRYFKNKEELIAAIIEHYLVSLVRRLMVTDTKTSTPAEVVVAAIHVIEEQMQSHESVLRIMPQVWAESMRNPEIHQRGDAIYTMLLEHFAEVVQHSQRRGELSKKFEVSGVAQMMLSLVQGFLLQSLFMTSSTNAAQYSKTAAQMLNITG